MAFAHGASRPWRIDHVHMYIYVYIQLLTVTQNKRVCMLLDAAKRHCVYTHGPEPLARACCRGPG